MKRFLSLTAMLLLTIATFAYDACIDGIYYNFSGDNAVVTLYSHENVINREAYKGNVIIPSCVTYNGKVYTVISIGDGAFFSCTKLTSLTIPESVRTIGSRIVSGCTNLSSINIPYGVTYISSSAFQDCTGLISLILPASITYISVNVFKGCSEMKTLKICSEAIQYQTNTYNTPFSGLNTNCTILCHSSQVSKIKGMFSGDVKSYVGTDPYFSDVHSTATTFNCEVKYNAGALNVISAKFDGYNTEGTKLFLTGLDPNTLYSVKYIVNTAEGGEETTTYTFKTNPLTLKTEQPKVVSAGNVVVAATTNVDENEENVGFEWRRTDWTSDFASNSGSAVVYGNTMEGYIRNMNTDKLWTYRAYYLSDAGTYYYGDWVGLDASNTSYFEPTVHTYADISTSGKVALIRGYVLNGTDKIMVQGFKYWKRANSSNSLDIDMEDEPQAAAVTIPADAVTETVAIVGSGQQMMNATLNNLDYGSTYQCVAFATTSENETFYGEVQSFTTEADPTGIEGVKEDAGSSKPATVVACYDINGKRLSQPQKGLNILRMSDGTTRKVVR